MQFTAAAVVAPNVPDKLDPIKYLTCPPQTKAQEQAQAQAQALAYGKLHGMSVSELERVIYGSETRKPLELKVLSKEEEQALQDAKRPYIPTRIEPPPDIHYTQVDYPYLFTSVRTRPVFQSLEVSRNTGGYTGRESSEIGKVRAPTLTLSMQEALLGSQYLENIKDTLAQFGIVKLRMPKEWIPARVPFGPETRAFKTRKQVVLNPNSKFDYNQIRRGFFQALIRFHTSTPQKRRMSKLPTLERRPVDFYRLFILVEQRGGTEEVVKRKEWAQVGRELGYSSNTSPTLSSSIRQLYTRILQPFKAWLDAQLPGKKIDFHVILRLDVDDEGKSKWHRLEHGIVIDLSKVTLNNISNRNIIEFDDLRYAGPNTTLRGFKQKQLKKSSDSLSSQDLESQFAKLPEYYESERVGPKPKLYRQSEEAMSQYSTETATEHSVLDPWDLTLLSLRNNTAFYPYIIDQDLDELVVPEFDVGNRFATEPWYKPKSGTYEANMIVDGQSRTWYTKNGVWTDQHASEIVIIDPNATVMNWCHGYSAQVSTKILLNSNWLLNVNEVDSDTNTFVCVQQIVYEIANSKEDLDLAVKEQALFVLERLRERELKMLAELSSLNIEKRTAVDHPPIICSQTRMRRYFSWVIVNGEPWSLEAFLKQYKQNHSTSEAFVHSKLRLVCKYEDASSFFDSLKSKLKAIASKESPQWWDCVNNTIHRNQNALPTEEELSELIKIAPSAYHGVSLQLKMAIGNLHKWLNSEDKVHGFSNLVECADKDGVVMNEYNRIINGIKLTQELWAEVQDIIESDVKLTDASDFISKINNILNSCDHYLKAETKSAIQRLVPLVEWAESVRKLLRDPPRDEPEILKAKIHHLVRKMPDFQGVAKSRPGDQLTERASIMCGADSRIRMLLDGSLDLDPVTISGIKRKFFDRKDYDNTRNIDPTLAFQFNMLCENYDLFRKAASPSVTDRPKRSEFAIMAHIPVVASIIAQLDWWLQRAKQLDWVSIATQLAYMAQGAPIDHSHPINIISISEIVRVYAELYALKCVPDDIVSVYATFENTIQRLNATPVLVLQRYGFFP